MSAISTPASSVGSADPHGLQTLIDRMIANPNYDWANDPEYCQAIEAKTQRVEACRQALTDYLRTQPTAISANHFRYWYTFQFDTATAQPKLVKISYSYQDAIAEVTNDYFCGSSDGHPPPLEKL